MIQSQNMVSVLISKETADQVRKVHDKLDTNNHCRDFVEEFFSHLNDLDDGEMINNFKTFFQNWKSGSCSWNAEKVLDKFMNTEEKYSFSETYQPVQWDERSLINDLMNKLNV